MDTILTVVLVLACIAMIALSAILIYEFTRDIMKNQKAAKRRDELIKKWANMKLDKPGIYLDNDAIHYTWSLMETSCKYINDIYYCSYHYDEKINKCNYSTCPLLHATERSKGIDSKRADK